jgi:hypothetical protein
MEKHDIKKLESLPNLVFLGGVWCLDWKTQQTYFFGQWWKFSKTTPISFWRFLLMMLMSIIREGEYLDHLKLMFERLKVVNLKFNLGKCCFGEREITFMRHMVDQHGSHLDPSKVQALLNFHVPMSIINVRAFFCLRWYYKKFIKGHANLVGPLFDLIKKDHIFHWTLLFQISFDTFKQKLLKVPIWLG